MIALPEGSLFANRYRVVRLIGQGGMGAVFEVVHLETERRRALKVMNASILESEDMRARFRQEAKVAAHVDSEHIVDVFDAGVDEATKMPFLVMELLRGEELKKKLKAEGRLSPHDVALYLHQTALALDKTHRANIIHRDLKPENLFLTIREDGRPHIKVLDFGVAKFLTEGGTSANATNAVGTPLYMAPEQFHMTNAVSPRTDIYAIGMIAYTLLVGCSYWAEEARSGASVFAFAAVMGKGPEEPASQRARRRGVPLSLDFDRWFAKATSARPADRFESASVTVNALADALGVPRPGLDMASSGRHGFPMATGAMTNAPISAPPGSFALGSAISADHALATGAALASTAGPPRTSKSMVAAIAGVSTLFIGLGIIAILPSRKDAAQGAPENGVAISAQAAPPSALNGSSSPSPSSEAPGPSLSAATAPSGPAASASASASSQPSAKARSGKPASNSGAARPATPPPKKDLFTRD